MIESAPDFDMQALRQLVRIFRPARSTLNKTLRVNQFNDKRSETGNYYMALGLAAYDGEGFDVTMMPHDGPVGEAWWSEFVATFPSVQFIRQDGRPHRIVANDIDTALMNLCLGS